MVQKNNQDRTVARDEVRERLPPAFKLLVEFARSRGLELPLPKREDEKKGAGHVEF